jgi:hypothetical protein
MLPGPDHILTCPTCKTHIRLPTLQSGNTFGARHWTDGYMHAPMLPQQPSITRCRECDTFFWLSDAEKVGEFNPWDQAHRPR